MNLMKCQYPTRLHATTCKYSTVHDTSTFSSVSQTLKRVTTISALVYTCGMGLTYALTSTKNTYSRSPLFALPYSSCTVLITCVICV